MVNLWRFRIPSYTEWIYATGSKTNNETKVTNLVGNKEANKIAWFAENSQDQLHEVGKKKNHETIYDLNGNVSEWCEYYECNNASNWFYSTLVLGGNYQSNKEELYLEQQHKTSKKGMFSTVGIRVVQTYYFDDF